MEPGRCRVEIQFGHVVEDVDEHLPDLQHFGFADGRSPGISIVVSPHRGDRRNFSERAKNVRVSDVTCVDDIVAAPQRLDRFRPEKTVSVGDKTDLSCGGRRHWRWLTISRQTRPGDSDDTTDLRLKPPLAFLAPFRKGFPIL